MDIKRLEYFCAIIEKGQITKAAKSLHISQPPLSQRLKELEEELGVTLVHRKGKEWQVTPEGYWFYQKAQYILSYVEGVKNDIAGISGELHGLVRLGVCPPCRQVGASIITEMAKEFPRVRYRSWIMDNQSLERHLQENHLDFALILLPVTPANYTIRALRPRPSYAVFGEGMPAPGRTVIGIRDLAGVPLIIQHRRDNEEEGGKGLLLAAFQRHGIQPNIALETQDSSFLRQLLRGGFPAVGILNETEVEDKTIGERFPTARIEEESLNITPAVITLKGSYTNAAAQRIIDMICERF